MSVEGTVVSEPTSSNTCVSHVSRANHLARRGRWESECEVGQRQ